ncbi:MAG: tyrosine-type recombinase/integrase [Bryobacteraceae bacterium]
MKLCRYAPLEHPLVQQFQRAIDSLTAALSPASARQYRAVARCFLIYLGEDYPAIRSLDQLRRDPHILGWFVDLRSQNLAPAVYIARLLLMRCMLEELAWSAQIPDLVHLIRREEIPRASQRLPRALTAQQDQLIQQELLRRNDMPSNVFLLLRHTGMRIGECVDLAYDCLDNTGPDRWAIHVPLGKLKTERMVPIDSFVCQLVHRLRFFRSFDPLPFDGRLLARPRDKHTLEKQLRPYLSDVAAAVRIPIRIVPHQLRHTYASEMVRAGVGLPALMKLLGHVNPEMTMRYVDVAGSDLQREFHLARSQPRHLAPQPKAPDFSPRGGLDGVVDSLLFAQHAIEMFRRSLPDGPARHRLDQLANRLTKILAETRKISPAG